MPLLSQWSERRGGVGGGTSVWWPHLVLCNSGSTVMQPMTSKGQTFHHPPKWARSFWTGKPSSLALMED